MISISTLADIAIVVGCLALLSIGLVLALACVWLIRFVIFSILDMFP